MVLGDDGAQLRPAECFGDGQPSALDARTLQRNSTWFRRPSVIAAPDLLLMAGLRSRPQRSRSRIGSRLMRLARPRLYLASLMMAALALAPVPSQAAREVGLIRDAEIEHTLRELTGPILEAAGLGRDSVQIYIVQDDQLNAFVAGGMNLFLNTGLLMRTQHPGQLAGVIAHEVGHIAGGHLSRIPLAAKRATAEMILATLLGVAAGVATGDAGVGAAIITGGQSYAQSGFMRFSRSQEQAADQAGLTYLDRVGISARGMAEFFHILEQQNVLAVSSMSPYLQSHPLTRDRINFVENHVANGPIAETPPGQAEAHTRMVVKLQAFLNDPRQTLRQYRDDQSVAGRYARAIAFYRVPDLERALAEIDGLLAEYPDDPYFHELKGQMLFENGHIEEAIGPYRESVRLAPGEPLLEIGLASALVEAGEQESNREAIGHLEDALQVEPTNAFGWRLLGIAQGRAGEEGHSNLSLAEYALLVGKPEDARLYARRAEDHIDPGDPAWLRLQDVLRVIEES
jgi:predicted Zn-dependent protease